MKLHTLAAMGAALGLAACTTVPENAKPYSCKEYNAARAQISKYSTPQQAWDNAETAKFMKINLVGFKSALSKHPGSREKVMSFIDNNTDLQAMQCRVAPTAVVHYTAEQVTPASVRLGYFVEYKDGKPAEIATLEGNIKRGSVTEIPNEAGMSVVKQFIQDCAANSAPARVCKLGNL